MIQGLTIIPNYITVEQEQALLQHIELNKEIIRAGTKRNTIKRYGSKLPYNGRMVSDQIPAHFQAVCTQLFTDGHMPFVPDSVTVNEYKQGQGIDYHIDSKKSGPIIIVLSLLGSATMAMQKDGVEEFCPILPRTLVKLEGEARTVWKHKILPVEHDRVSLVFRKGTKK